MKTTSRTISQIVRAHTLTYFNLLNVILAGFIILSGQYKNMLFMGIVISNSLIGIIQECKVKSLIDKLSVITATKARKLAADGTITEIPIESLAVSDTIHIMTGDQIVADGEVLTSDGLEVNESHLTGESIPVFKKPGDFLYSGSFIVAGSGTAKVLKSVEDSYAAKLTKKAQTKRRATSEMQDAIKRIIRYVSFAIVPIGAALFCIQYFRADDTLSNALVSTVAGVLGMIPEGLVLLTSVSFILGVGRLARKKALVQEMEAIEALARVNVLCLDKTGTITEGTPSVTNLLCRDGIGQNELLQIAASLEKLSEHPLAESIVKEAENERISFLPVENFRQVPGQGIIGEIENEICFAGNRRLLEANGISGGVLQSLGDAMAEEGKTPLFFARGKELMGVIAVADVVKPTSRQAVQELSGMGIEVVMLTGDNRKTAEAIQRQVGVNRVVAEVFPQDKEKEIRRLQDSGKKVTMVGDGINDAPALARADVGIAIGAGTDIAIESADIVLMKSDLLDVSTAIQLSKAVIRNIKQNLFWAFIYNIIGIPVAAGLFYLPFGLKLNPMIGAFAMSFSSVFVVSNALRLRWFKAKHTSHENTDMEFRQENDKKENKGASQMEKVLNIEGMVCMNCVKHVEKALRELAGISEVTVSLAEKSARIQLNGDVSDAMLKEAVEDAGYQLISIQ